MTRSPEPERDLALDGVRGLAILAVAVMHVALYLPFVLLPLVEEHGVEVTAVVRGLAEGYMRLVMWGWCGVDLFFVLSGFLITGILVKSKGAPHYFRNFYARRALRIFPLYYVVIVMQLFVLRMQTLPAGETLAYLAYFQNLWLAFAERPVAKFSLSLTWSLAIEEQFYLVWPALVLLVSRRGLVVAGWVFVVGAISVRLLSLQAGMLHTHFMTWCRLDALAAGALLAVLPRPPVWFGLVSLLAGASGLAAIQILTGEILQEAPVMQRYGLPSALALAVGILVLARHRGVFAAICRWAPLRSFGRFSYCIYLIHIPVITFATEQARALRVTAVFGDVLLQRPALVYVFIAAFTMVSLALAWGVGWLSWHLFEKRVLRLKDRFPNGG